MALARLAPDLSRRAARRLIDEGSVYVAGRRTRVLSRVVAEGEEIVVELGARPNAQPAPPDDELLLRLDPSFVAVDKPAGMPTEPTRQAAVGTLSVTLKDLLRRAGHDVSFLAAAHRLDADTSGVVVFARTKKAAAALARQFREGSVERKYLALVAGAPEFVTTRLDAPLSRHPDARGRFSVDEDGLPSSTRFTALAKGRGASLVLAEPLTGRTHQLRVHLLHLGHPLVGDKRYVDQPLEPGCLGLHAAALAFDDPAPSSAPRGPRLVIAAPPPTPFLAAAARFGIPEAAVRAAVDSLAGDPVAAHPSAPEPEPA